MGTGGGGRGDVTIKARCTATPADTQPATTVRRNRRRNPGYWRRYRTVTVSYSVRSGIAFAGGKKERSVKLTTHFQLVQR
jgi:hypothetical protein